MKQNKKFNTIPVLVGRSQSETPVSNTGSIKPWNDEKKLQKLAKINQEIAFERARVWQEKSEPSKRINTTELIYQRWRSVTV